jgi:FdhD protein
VKFPVIKVRNGTASEADEIVVEEIPLTIYLNGQEFVTVLCSPGGECELVTGLLASEGMIAVSEDISSFSFEPDRNMAWVEAKMLTPTADKLYLRRCLSACCGKGRVGFYYAGDARVREFNGSKLSLTVEEALFYQAELDRSSLTFQATGGVHSGALASAGSFVCFRQDIGRHNVFDRIYGCCLRSGISTADKVLVFSGRVSSEVLLKVAKMHISIIVAHSAPTSLALELAEELGITVIGFARNDRMNVYTQAQRIVFL